MLLNAVLTNKKEAPALKKSEISMKSASNAELDMIIKEQIMKEEARAINKNEDEDAKDKSAFAPDHKKFTIKVLIETVQAAKVVFRIKNSTQRSRWHNDIDKAK